MARLQVAPPGSRFLSEPPLGAYDMYRSLSADSSASSHISPLALPRSLGVTGYFDHHSSVTSYPQSGANAHANNFAPLGDVLNGSSSISHPYPSISAGLQGPPQAQPRQFLSPNLTPTSHLSQYSSRQRQASIQRSASLSPTRHTAARLIGGRTRTRSAMVTPTPGMGVGGFIPPGIQEEPSIPGISPSFHGVLNGTEKLSIFSRQQSQSEADSASSQTSPDLVDSLRRQNARIKDAWQAERKHLQENIERAEEVYNADYALMEEERRAWRAERDQLVQEIEALRHKVISLGGSSSLAELMGYGEGPADRGLRGSGWSSKSGSLRGSEASQSNGVSHFSNGISQPSRFAGLQTRGMLGSIPGMSQHHNLSPLGRSEDQHQSTTFTLPPQNSMGMAAPAVGSAQHAGSNEAPVPTVDVQEIHPDLEGIPIKATAIQQTTFSDRHISPDASRLSSGKPSPPIATDGSSDAPKRPSKEQTLQMLKVNVSDRLVMHAGHTPNHSMSFLPTAMTSEVSTTIDSNGSTTPTIRGDGSGPEDIGGDDDETSPKGGNLKGKAVATIESAVIMPATTVDEVLNGMEDQQFDPLDDPPLKGPLMVRNIPAHDEIFFRRLSDKLEVISRGEDAVPKALRDSMSEDAPAENGAAQASAGCDGAADSTGKDDSPKSETEEEKEIPLRLKRSNNFGAPLGEYR